jgi:hypothetical protein
MVIQIDLGELLVVLRMARLLMIYARAGRIAAIPVIPTVARARPRSGWTIVEGAKPGEMR